MANIELAKTKLETHEPKYAEGSWADQWRPYMAFAYMAICLFDFIVGPTFWSIIQVIGKGTVSLQWIPLTLQGAGVFHFAMGAILGISAFTRGQEKVQRLKTLEELTAVSSDSSKGVQ